MIWCFRCSMYIARPSENVCVHCEKFDECYEYNKQLQKAIEEGRAIVSPLQLWRGKP